jgi:hypothetical protein
MNGETAPRIRGTIIKVPDTSPGLLSFNGQQRPFNLDGIWRSPVAPAVNMTVDVATDASGGIVGLSAVDSQQLAKEKLDQFSGVAQERGKQAAEIAKQGVGALAARMGKVPMIATVLLWFAWFFLPSFSVNMIVDTKSFTYWEFLGIDFGHSMAGFSVDHGFFSVIGFLAILAPFVAPFVPHPNAKYLNAAPLAFLVLAFLKFKWEISHALGQSAKEMGEFGAEMAKAAQQTLSDAISTSWGLYVLVLAAIVVAVFAFKPRANG